jgi:hypothetical protein
VPARGSPVWRMPSAQKGWLGGEGPLRSGPLSLSAVVGPPVQHEQMGAGLGEQVGEIGDVLARTSSSTLLSPVPSLSHQSRTAAFGGLIRPVRIVASEHRRWRLRQH